MPQTIKIVKKKLICSLYVLCKPGLGNYLRIDTHGP